MLGEDALARPRPGTTTEDGFHVHVVLAAQYFVVKSRAKNAALRE